MKLKTNILSVADCIYVSVDFDVIQSHLTEIETRGKMLIALERNKPAISALRTSKENNFLYLTARFEVKMCPRYDTQNVLEKFT